MCMESEKKAFCFPLVKSFSNISENQRNKSFLLQDVDLNKLHNSEVYIAHAILCTASITNITMPYQDYLLIAPICSDGNMSKLGKRCFLRNLSGR